MRRSRATRRSCSTSWATCSSRSTSSRSCSRRRGKATWRRWRGASTRSSSRRHPHVFGDAEAKTAGRVRENWERIKRDQEGREGVFHDVPEALPALLYARKVQRRAAAVGFDYPDATGALADLDDELVELKADVDDEAAARRGARRRPLRRRQRRAQARRRPRARAAAGDRPLRRARRGGRAARRRGRATIGASSPLAEQDRYFDLAKEMQ